MLGDQRAREVLGVERAQILDRLADADQLHRQLELARDRQRDPAARGAVELRQHDAGDLARVSANSFAWRSPFWPVVASIVSSVSCGAPSSWRAITRRTFAELAHQVVLGVQAPGGVDDHDVDARCARLRDRLEGDRARVRALGAGHDLAARALRPALELLAGRRPERVGRAEQHAAPELAAQVPRELADRRRLAGPVHADGHDHGRLGADVDPAVADARRSRRAARSAAR